MHGTVKADAVRGDILLRAHEGANSDVAAFCVRRDVNAASGKRVHRFVGETQISRRDVQVW